MRFTKFIALASLCAGAALADETNHFTVAGMNPDGAAYTGTVAVTELPSEGVGKGDRFIVTWTTGGESVTGIGVVSPDNRKVLSVAYSIGGNPGIAVMTEGSGNATGIWTMDGAPGLGTEVWTPVP